MPASVTTEVATEHSETPGSTPPARSFLSLPRTAVHAKGCGCSKPWLLTNPAQFVSHLPGMKKQPQSPITPAKQAKKPNTKSHPPHQQETRHCWQQTQSGPRQLNVSWTLEGQ